MGGVWRWSLRRFPGAAAAALCLALNVAAARAADAPTPAGEVPPGPAPRSHPGEATPAQATPGVSLEQVLTLARQRAPEIDAARARLLQAEGSRYAGAVLPDPGVAYGSGRGEARTGGASASESTLELSQFFPSPWALRSRSRSGSASIEAARQGVGAVVVEVVFEAKRLYYEAATAGARATALSQAALDAASLSRLVARRVEVGEAPESDHLRTDVEARRTGIEARSATSEAGSARRVLDRFLLGALGDDFTLSTVLGPETLPPPPDDFLEIALARSPIYRALQSRVEAARWELSAERSSRLPGIGVSMFRERELDREATGAGLSLVIPLWNRNEGAVRIAHGGLLAAEAEAAGARRRIEMESERLIARDRTAREIAVAYQRDILPSAGAALAIAAISVEHGEASLLSWLEARRSYLEILRASYDAQLQAYLARAELDRLMGDSDASW